MQNKPMEKSMSDSVTPVQTGSSALLLVAVGGFSLFWATFFSMLMRNSFLDADIENLWYHLVLRIALFVGFGICSYCLSRTPQGAIAGRRRQTATGFVIFFSIIALISSASYSIFQIAHPLVFDLVAWGLSGAGLCCLFFLWIGTLDTVARASVVTCLALSVACGSGFYLIMTMLPHPFNIAMLVVCPLLSLGILHALDTGAPADDAGAIPLGESRENAHLSWALGTIYVVYGIVFGLGAGSITQIQGDATLFVGIAAFTALGALAAYGFMRRFAGRIEQSNMLKMVFPFLVIALVPMSLMSDTVYALCNLLLLGAYVFLLLASIAFELQTAHARRASHLFFIGTSQTALSAGLAIGCTLGLFASITGAVDYSVLSGIALGLVVLLAALVTFAPIEPLAATQTASTAANGSESESAAVGDEGHGSEAGEPHEPEHEHEHEHEPGHWKACCAALAERYALSPRETEVFFYLAKGRGIEHIQNKLFISSHTVKTHTYNIYRKMNVGSREELLDIIEEEKCSQKNG